MRIGPFGIWEILIILTVILVIFGPSRLPKVAKGLGQSIREFRSGLKEFKGEIEDETVEASRQPAVSRDGAAS